MKNRQSRRERGELASWRVALIFVLGMLVRLAAVIYVIWMVWMIATGGFEGWW